MGKDLFDGGGTLADGVEGAWVAVVDKVGGVVIGAGSTVVLNQNNYKCTQRSESTLDRKLSLVSRTISFCLVSTEGALRKPMTYDNLPIPSIQCSIIEIFSPIELNDL